MGGQLLTVLTQCVMMFHVFARDKACTNRLLIEGPCCRGSHSLVASLASWH